MKLPSQKNHVHRIILTISTVAILALLILPKINNDLKSTVQSNETFNGERALNDVEYQMSLGPRTPGSVGHKLVVEWLQESLKEYGWETSVQKGSSMGHSISNIVAKKGEGSPWIILGAHYDSRLFADKDDTPQNRILPVPGANDGASGVAVLLELARVISHDRPYEIWLVFFDAEDNGNINGWDWILGSRYFVNSLLEFPDSMVLIDMIGDNDLNIYMEKNSDPTLKHDIWQIAASLGYSEYFIPINKYSMIDDHIPFIQSGIPSVNIIDFDYPYWHTVEDTEDKISNHSLQIVGDTLIAWLNSLRK